ENDRQATPASAFLLPSDPAFLFVLCHLGRLDLEERRGPMPEGFRIQPPRFGEELVPDPPTCFVVDLARQRGQALSDLPCMPGRDGTSRERVVDRFVLDGFQL